MQTETLTDPAAATTAGVSQLQPESPETQKERDVQVLKELQQNLAELANAFGALASVQAEEQALAGELQKIQAEETELLRDEDSPEKDLTKRLLSVRSIRDIRAARLKTAGDRTQIAVEDTLEAGQNLRRAFSGVARSLLVARQNRVLALLNVLWPTPTGYPVTNVELMRVAEPVQQIQRVANWIHQNPEPDPAQELKALQELPHRWFDALAKIIDSEAEFGALLGAPNS